MFFALTSDQQEFGAAVRDYLAQRFDLAAVRTVVENPSDDGNPASLWRAAGEQGGPRSPSTRTTTASVSAWSRPR